MKTRNGRSDYRGVRILRSALAASLIAFASAASAAAQAADSRAALDPPNRMPAIRLDLARHAQALGDRLRNPAKKRAALSGVLTDAAAGTVPVTLVRELPGKIRVDVGSGQNTLIFDRATAASSKGALSQTDERLLEMLAYDWPDQFLVNHGNGSGLRLIADQARVYDAGQPTGVWYDVYEAYDRVITGQNPRERIARYCFNSATGLLDRVRYQSPRGTVEVRFGDWQVIAGERVPGRVERVENGTVTSALTISAAAFGPAVNDGAFVNPAN